MISKAEPIDVSEHIGFAYRIASIFTKNTREQQHYISVQDTDEYSDAMLGLVLAAKKYDPTKGVRFITYAYPWMRGAIIRGRKKRQSDNEALEYMDQDQPTWDNRESPELSDYLTEVRILIRMLKPKRRALMAEVLTGKTVAEAARAIGMDTSKAGKYYRQTIAYLREELGLDPDGHDDLAD